MTKRAPLKIMAVKKKNLQMLHPILTLTLTLMRLMLLTFLITIPLLQLMEMMHMMNFGLKTQSGKFLPILFLKLTISIREPRYHLKLFLIAPGKLFAITLNICSFLFL